MPGSANATSGGVLPGLNVLAWALVSSAGALLKGFNVASITKGGTGFYTLNFTAALPSASVVLTGELTTFLTTPRAVHIVSATTAAVGYYTHVNGAQADTQHFVAVYG